MIKKYRQIPVVCDAVQWDGKNLDEIKELVGDIAHVYSGCLFISSDIGPDLIPNATDYVLKSGTENHPIIRVVTQEIFEKVYEEVE